MTLVATYGTLKRGQSNHRLLEQCTRLGVGVTDPTYDMYSLGGFPCITEGGTTPVHIEVYEVDDVVMGRLDMLEGYPSFYNRKEIETEFGKAWIYYIEDTSHMGELNKIVDGRW